MFADLDLRLVVAIIAVGITVYQNWKAAITREAKQEELNKSLVDRIENIVADQKDRYSALAAELALHAKSCDERVAASENIFVRKEQFRDQIAPVIAQLKVLQEANIPIKLAKIETQQEAIIASLKRLEDRAIAGAYEPTD